MQRRALQASLLSSLLLVCSTAAAQTPTPRALAIPAAQPADGCPVIHVYLDVSGSVQAGPEAARRLLHILKPQLELLGGSVQFYTFKSEVTRVHVLPTAESVDAALSLITSENQRKSAPLRGFTNVTCVWRHILDQTRHGGALQAFFVISDFVHTARNVSWDDYMRSHEVALHMVAQTNTLRLIRLEPLPTQVNAQRSILASLKTVLGGAVEGNNERAIAESVSHVQPVALRIADDKLRLRNNSCREIKAHRLRVRRSAKEDDQETVEMDAITLAPRGGEQVWPLKEAFARVAVVGEQDQALSDELVLKLLPDDVTAHAFLIGNNLQVFLEPMRAIGSTIDGRVEVLMPGGEGSVVLAGDVRVLPAPQRHPAPLSGNLESEQAASLAMARTVSLRVTPVGGDEFRMDEVAVHFAPSMIAQIGWPLLWVGVVVALAWIAVYRWWPCRLTLGEGVVSLMSGGIGSGTVFFADIKWIGWGIGAFAVSAGLALGWCAYVFALPSERRTASQMQQLLSNGGYETKLLSTRPYTAARLVALLVFAVSAFYVWTLLDGRCTDVAKERPHLERLQRLARDGGVASETQP